MVAPVGPRDDRLKIPPGPEGSNGIDRFGRRVSRRGSPPFLPICSPCEQMGRKGEKRRLPNPPGPPRTSGREQDRVFMRDRIGRGEERRLPGPSPPPPNIGEGARPASPCAIASEGEKSAGSLAPPRPSPNIGEQALAPAPVGAAMAAKGLAPVRGAAAAAPASASTASTMNCRPPRGLRRAGPAPRLPPRPRSGPSRRRTRPSCPRAGRLPACR